MMSIGQTHTQNRSSLAKYAIVGGITFVAGIGATLMLSSYLQSGQRDAIAALTEQVQLMQAEVTRAATVEPLALPVVEEPSQDVAVTVEPVVEILPEIEATGLIPSATAALATPDEPVEVLDASVAPAAEAQVLPVEEQISREDRIAEALAAVHRNKMRMLTEGVLAGLYSVTSEETEAGGTQISIDARNARTTTAEIQALLEEAARDGSVELPASVSTADGDVDTSTLLFDLVQRSLEAEGEAGAAAAAELRQQAFAVSGATTEVENGQRYYTVEAGDSLAYISLQFYGNTNAYDRIFQANLDILDSPDRIRTGQRLVIPDA